MKRTNWLIVLLIGITLSLMGCAAPQMKIPTKPVLTAIESDGMICFSRGDSVKLGRYIMELERGYD